MTPPQPNPDEPAVDAPPAGRSRLRRAFVCMLVAPFVLVALGVPAALGLYHVPTGSMVPSILGRHYGVDCPACGATWAVGAREPDSARRTVALATRCPGCGRARDARVPAASAAPGNRILVDRTAFLRGAPRRFDAVTFDHRSGAVYVSRVAGLPGETLEVDGGDLFVDGEIARKPAALQRRLWTRALGADEAGDSTPRWRPHADARGWTVGPRRVVRGADGRGWVAFARPVVYVCAYDRSFAGGRVPVPDLRIRARANRRTAGVVRLAVVEDSRVVAGRFPFGEGPGPFALEVDDREVARAEEQALPTGAAADVGLAYADERAWLTVGGRRVLVWDDPEPRRGSCTRAGARLSADGPAAFRDLRLDRDVHYGGGLFGEHDPSHQPVPVPAGHVFFLADHSHDAQDSRHYGPVAIGDVTGRVLGVLPGGWW